MKHEDQYEYIESLVNRYMTKHSRDWQTYKWALNKLVSVNPLTAESQLWEAQNPVVKNIVRQWLADLNNLFEKLNISTDLSVVEVKHAFRDFHTFVLLAQKFELADGTTEILDTDEVQRYVRWAIWQRLPETFHIRCDAWLDLKDDRQFIIKILNKLCFVKC